MKLANGTYLNNGKYRIERVLGQGSFGITYLATVNIVGALGSIPSSTKVAIKEFFMREVNGRHEETVTTGNKDGIFYNYKRRFIKEARTLSKLNHPNIVHVLDLFEENNTAYYVMEYLDGGSLDKLISDKNGLSVLESSQLIRQIASALDYMHSHRMLHLDLKPANVMLNKRGDAVLIDFGLTKEFDENGFPESSTTVGHGTPGYAPIEQSNYQVGQGFPVTMDIYALGATLYKMLSSKLPPNASDILNEGVEILNLQFIQNSNVADAISKAMNPLKNKRFQSVNDFISALKLSSSKNSNTDSTFPYDTISYLIIMKNQVAIYYYRGTVYKDLNGSFLKNINKIGSISDLRNQFDCHFTRYEDLSFGDFIFQYKETMSNSDSVYTSFFNIDDYFRIISAIESSERYHHVRRIMRENSYVAAYLSSQLLEKESSKGSSLDVLASVNYNHSELGFAYGDGVCEIYSDFKTLKDSYNTGEEKRYLIKSSENLRLALLGGILIEHFILTGKESNILLLDILPFDIQFGPHWGKSIPKMIEAGTTIPTRKSDSFDFVGTDYVAVRIGNRNHLINLIKDFGYAPKEIECTVEVGSAINDIRFEITDKSTGKSKSYSIKNLTMLHYEAWKEPEWT